MQHFNYGGFEGKTWTNVDHTFLKRIIDASSDDGYITAEQAVQLFPGEPRKHQMTRTIQALSDAGLMLTI